MGRSTESPEQRQARTSKARATLAAKFATPEERSAHYRRVAQARWSRRDSGGHSDEQHPVPAPDPAHGAAPPGED